MSEPIPDNGNGRNGEALRDSDALRRSDERYRELIENASDIIYSHDLAGNLTSLNKAAERLTGYTHEEALKLNISQVVVPEHLELARQNLQRKLAGDDTPAYELEILAKDGRRVLLEVNTRLTHHNGKPVGVQGIGRDVTERKRAQEALKMQARVLESMIEGVSVADEEGFILYTNPAKDAMFGYEPGELIGKHVSTLNIYPPEENARIVCEIIEQLKTQGSWSGEFSNRKKDGTLFTTSARISALDISGKKHWVSVQQDVTERKRAEKVQAATYRISEAANAAESLQALFRSIHEIVGELLPVPNLYIALYDEASKTFSFPYHVDERTPCPAPRRLGRGATEYTFRTGSPAHVPPDVLEELIRRGEVELSGAPSVDWFGVPLKTKDNAIGVLVVQSYDEGVTFEEDEKNILVFVSEQIAMAIERKRAEQERARLLDLERAARSESERLNRLRAEMLERERAARAEAERQRMSLDLVVDQMAEGFVVWDETMTVVRANRQAQQIFGFRFEEMRDDRDFCLLEGRFADENDQTVAVDDLPIQAALRELRIADRQLWYTRPDGQQMFLSLTASPFLDDQNQLAGATLLVRDVTERRRQGERAQQADKLRALGQLASGVAHNFNNALAAVIGYTQLALPKVKQRDVEKYLRVVEQSAKDAARMVERIQNFSRGSSPQHDFLPVRLSDIVHDAVDITRPRWLNDAQALGIKYEVKLGWQAEEDSLVSGESSELREVFVNIIFNALDAMPLGGVLTIAATPSGQNINVSFSDTGVGMTQEIKRRIFEPFFTTKGVAGLGMGLSESYRIIERHGGRFEVESQLRRGATFTIILPQIECVENAAQLQTVTIPVAPARVLVVDDEESVRSVLAEILEDQGHSVALAASAEEARHMVEIEDFDVVFTDLAMPTTDGVTAAAEIKSRKPATKVVLMSGYGSYRAYECAGDSNCIDAAISKPFRMDEIHEAMKSLLGQ